MINGISSSTNALLGTQIGGTRATDATGRTDATKTGPTSASTIMAQMAAEGAPIEMDRVAAIKAAIKAGTYHADPDAIASKMVDLDLGGVTK
jgi:negative regulator of flagellin synthesis FlgM